MGMNAKYDSDTTRRFDQQFAETESERNARLSAKRRLAAFANRDDADDDRVSELGEAVMTPETSAIPSGDTERVERIALLMAHDPKLKYAAARDLVILQTRLRDSEDEARRLREDALAAGIKAAADWVRDRRFEHEKEHGYIEPDTGALRYGSGAHAWAKEEYNCELCEIEEGLRALAAPQAPGGSSDEGDKK